MISPALFPLFIDEFKERIRHSCLKGIPLHPDIIEIFILLFSDDVAFLSDIVLGLQRQLHLLLDFCKEKKTEGQYT